MDREEGLSLLADIGLICAEGVGDRLRIMRSIAERLVPSLADWCSIYVLDEGEFKPLVVTHVEPDAAAIVREVYERWPLPPDSPYGFPAVVRSGKTQLTRGFDDDARLAAARDEEHLALLRRLGGRSWITAPLKLRDLALGALVVVRTAGRPDFDESHVAVIEEIGRRAAFVIDHARLFEEVVHEKAKTAQAIRGGDELLAVVSHELRSPLNAIAGWAAMLAGGSVPLAKVRRAAQVIARNAAAQAALIEDLVDVSRMSTGNVRLERAAVSLAEIVDRAMAGARPLAAAKQVELHAQFDTEGTEAFVDPERVHQIAANLIGNAIKFTPAGGRVDVQLRRIDSDLEILVSDTGIGMDPESLAVIWERFRQLDTGASRRHGGMGLGLWIVRQLVELHGGTVAVQSEGKDRGSTFTVRLPAEPADATPPPAFAAPTIESRSPMLEGMRVVVVEDDRDSREMIVELLRMSSAVAFEAATVDEALRLLDERRPHAIISDIGLPGETGYSLAARVRARSDATASTPLIALTGFARAADRRRAMAGGFNAHFAKPVDASELVAALAAYRG